MTRSDSSDDHDSGLSDTHRQDSNEAAPHSDSDKFVKDHHNDQNDACASTVVGLSGKPPELGGYVLGRELGRGGMGIVYEATHQTLRRRVAVKILPAKSQLDRTQALRFANESRAAAQLDHANIVPVYEVGEEDGVSYFVMRLIEGKNLSQLIKTIRFELSQSPAASAAPTPQLKGATTVDSPRQAPGVRRETPDSDGRNQDKVDFSADDFARKRSARKYASTWQVARNVAKIGIRVADALQHAHATGVVHRDIKPCNLMLDDGGTVWVTDFGLARILDTPSLTETGMLLGTYRYMSPEQASGNASLVDQRTDIYSLGVTLCELLTLQKVITGSETGAILKEVIHGAPISIRRIDAGVPVDLAVILEKAMSRDPQERYQTAAAMADDLNRFLNNQPIHARRPPLWKRCQQWLSRHKAIAIGLAAMLTATFLLTAISAAVVWNALMIEQKAHDRTEVALSESEGLRLLANSALQLPQNPGLSLTLAVAGAASAPGIEADAALLAALDANHEVATLPQKTPRGQVVMSPDGQSVVTCMTSTQYQKGSYPAHVHSVPDGNLRRILDDGECITSAAFNPSGTFIVTTSAPSALAAANGDQPLSQPPVIWDASTGKKIRTLTKAMIHTVHAGVFHPDGNRMVACRDNEAVVHNIRTDQSELVLRGHSDAVSYAEFSPDGNRILTVARDQTVRVWDATDGSESRPPIAWDDRHSLSVRVAFTASSDHFAVADRRGVQLYQSVVEDENSAPPIRGRRNYEMTVSRSRDYIALTDRIPGVVDIVSSVSLATLSRLQLPAPVDQVVFHPTDASVLVICGLEMYLFESESGVPTGQLLGHTRQISDASFNPQNGLIATVANDRTLRFWQARSGTRRARFRLHRPEVMVSMNPRPIAVSDDNRHINVSERVVDTTRLLNGTGTERPGTFAGTAIEGRIDTERLVTVQGRVVTVSAGSTSRILFRAEFLDTVLPETLLVNRGQGLLVRTNGRSFLIDVKEGSRTVIGTASERVVAAAASADGSVLLVGTTSGRCVSIDPGDGHELWSRRSNQPILSLDVSGDGQSYALVDTSGHVVFGEPGSADVNVRFDADVPALVKFVGDGSHVVLRDPRPDKIVRCYKSESGELVGELNVVGYPFVSTHPVRPLVAVASGDGARLWNVATDDRQMLSEEECLAVCLGRTQLALLVKQSGRNRENDPSATSANQMLVYSIAEDDRSLVHQEDLLYAGRSLSYDGATDTFAVVQRSFVTDVFELDTGRRAWSGNPHPSPLLFAEFLQAPQRLLTVSSDGVAQICDGEGSILTTFVASNDGITVAALSPDEKILVVGNSRGELLLWAVETQTEAESLTGHQAAVQILRFDESGHFLVSLAPDDPIHVWDLRTSQAVRYDVAGVQSTEFSPDGRQLLAIGTGKTKRTKSAWMINRTNQQVRELPQKTGTRAARFSGDGQFYGLLSGNGSLDIFHRESGEVVSTIAPMADRIIRFAFSHDGSMLTDHRHQLNVWDTVTGRQRGSFPRSRPESTYYHEDNWQPFTSDGKWIIAIDRGVRRFPRNALQSAIVEAPRQLSEEERRQFRLDLADVPSALE